MTDPVTLTAGAIATLAFSKFIEEGAGELAKKLTEGAIAKIDKLRAKIVARLKGKNERLDSALVQAERGDVTAVETVGEYLEIAMRDDKFAEEVRSLAREVHQELNIGQGSEVWNVIGKAEKNEFTDNKAPIFKDNTGTVTINYGTPPQ